MILGLDRESRNQPAGLRTHMLVGFGACLFTSLSVRAFPGSEEARVAAQVVTGIGFIGAGTILQLRQGDDTAVRHLTTAASIWSTAAIGMAVGAGAWFLAINGTIIGWVILSLVRRVELDK
jgi:putative Mg2+ transporter-C (MgtC) family protein